MGKRIKSLFFIIFCLLYAPYFTTGAQAAANEQGSHAISTGAGLASPSDSTSLVENPAGLIYNSGLSILGFMNSPYGNFNPIQYGGEVTLGVGPLAGGFSYQQFSGQPFVGNQTTLTGTLLSWGFAIDIPVTNITAGININYATGAIHNTWDTNIGVIFGARSSLRFGATIFKIFDGFEALGGGAALDIGSWGTVAIDAADDTKIGAFSVKPGLQVHIAPVQVALGYTFRAGGDSSGWIPDGFSFGAGFQLTAGIHLEFYFNQVAKYFAGASFHF